MEAIFGYDVPMSKEESNKKGVRVDPIEQLEATRNDPLGNEAPRSEMVWMDRLVSIMDLLRSPGGCPWDLDQEPRSIKPSVLEEAHEVLVAIDSNDDETLCEELGDLLLQVVFLSRMRKEAGAFTIQDVARKISEKLVRRHPHVFGDLDTDSTDEVVANWERIKDKERKEKGEESLMSGLPTSLPALLRAFRIGQKAQRVGFDWSGATGALETARGEMVELEEALAAEDEKGIREELGDVLFSLGQLARKLGMEPEEVLQEANAKFLSRFACMERLMQTEEMTWDSATPELLEQLWSQAKIRLQKD